MTRLLDAIELYLLTGFENLYDQREWLDEHEISFAVVDGKLRVSTAALQLGEFNAHRARQEGGCTISA